MWEFLQCMGIFALLISPFVGLFVLIGRAGADVQRPQRDEHAGKGDGAGIG